MAQLARSHSITKCISYLHSCAVHLAQSIFKVCVMTGFILLIWSFKQEMWWSFQGCITRGPFIGLTKYIQAVCVSFTFELTNLNVKDGFCLNLVAPLTFLFILHSRVVRKSIARVLTVINQTQKENLRKFYKVRTNSCSPPGLSCFGSFGLRCLLGRDVSALMAV